MRDFLEKGFVFGGIAFVFWLLTFDRPGPKQKKRDRQRELANEEERRRMDTADAAQQAQQNPHNHHR